MTFVYVVIHRASGAWYVGYTRQLPKLRWKRHKIDAKNGCEFRFHRALRAHGFDAFDWHVFGSYPSMYEGQEAEGALISFCRLKGIETYNCTDGGQGTTGWFHSDEVRRRISENLSGEKNPQFGVKQSAERRRNHSILMKTHAVRGADHYLYGRKHSEETIKKMSESMRAKRRSS